MSNESDYQRTTSGNTTIAYAKNQAQPKQKVILTAPLLHIKTKSRKYPGRTVTRGYYINLPKSTVEAMDIQDKELIEVTIRKIR